MASDTSALAEALRLAPQDGPLYIACREYVLRCDGDGNTDMRTNGELAVLRSTIPTCRVVFDVGAHTGAWTEAVLALNPTVTIHAFEPGARCAAALLAKRLPANVMVRQLALGARIEERELFLFGAYGELSSLYPRALSADFPIERPDASETIPVTTLDAYCADHGIGEIDFLKIDAEGHDLQVLLGGVGKFATQAIGAAQFEYGGANIGSRDLLQDFFAFFQDLRYDLYKLRAEGVMPVQRYDARLENFAYQNWLAVRRG
jgi:FkbM family methyltransferase